MAERYCESDSVIKEDDHDSDEKSKVKMMQDLAPTEEVDDDDNILNVSDNPVPIPRQVPLVNKTAELEVKKQLLLNMANVMQCFICKMPPSTVSISFLRCKTKHLVCTSCVENGTDCCNSNFEYEDCPLVSELMNQIGLLICRNRKNGCQEVKSYHEMLAHEEECPFRTVPCLHSFCDEKIVFLDYLLSYERSHPQPNIIKEKEQSISLKCKENIFTKKVKSSWTFIIEGATLTFVNKLLVQDQLVRIWFYILGSPKEAEHFRYELKIKKEAGKETKFFGKVRSINEDYKSFMESDDTFEMSYGMAKKYLNGESELEYTFKIRNLKEEAKDEDFESGIDDSD